MTLKPASQFKGRFSLRSRLVPVLGFTNDFKGSRSGPGSEKVWGGVPPYPYALPAPLWWVAGAQ